MLDHNTIKQYTERKNIEKATFDRLYLISDDNVPEIIRSQHLKESEEYFVECIKQLAPGKHVLEIGCGIGKHSIIAAKAGAIKVDAIDFSEQAIKRGRTVAKNYAVSDTVVYTIMDAENLLFKDNQFDLIINHEAFSSLDLAKVLPELKRVLKDGGVVLGKETFGHNPIFNFKRFINLILKKRTSWAVSHIFKNSDIAKAREYFSDISINYFHLFTPLLIPFRNILPSKLQNRLLRVFNSIDRKILSLAPLNKMSFKVVFKLVK